MFLPQPDQPLDAAIVARAKDEKFFRIAVETDEDEGGPHWEFYGQPSDDRIIQYVYREELNNTYVVQEFNGDGIPHGRYFYMPQNDPVNPYNEMHNYKDGLLDRRYDHVDLGRLVKIREQMRPILIKFGFEFNRQDVIQDAVPVPVGNSQSPHPPAAQSPWWKKFIP